MVRHLDVQHDNGRIIGFDKTSASERQTSTSKADFVSHPRPHQQVRESVAGYVDVPASVEYRLNQQKARHTFAEEIAHGSGIASQPLSSTTSKASYVPHTNNNESKIEYQQKQERGRNVDGWTKGFGEQQIPNQSSYASNYVATGQRPQPNTTALKLGLPHYNILTGKESLDGEERPANRVSYEKLRQVREAQNGPYDIISNENSPGKPAYLDIQTDQ